MKTLISIALASAIAATAFTAMPVAYAESQSTETALKVKPVTEKVSPSVVDKVDCELTREEASKAAKDSKYIRRIFAADISDKDNVIPHRKYLLGDTDNDGELTIRDVTQTQRFLAKINNSMFTFDYISMDVTWDSEITIEDVTAMQRYIAEFSGNDNIGNEFITNLRFRNGRYDRRFDIPDKITDYFSKKDMAEIDGMFYGLSALHETNVIDGSIDPITKRRQLSVGCYLNEAVYGQTKPEDISIQVNNGNYDYKIDYTDEKFTENYLKTEENEITAGYDCLVRDDSGREFAWVEAHFEQNLGYRFKAEVYALRSGKYSFPIDFYYKNVLIRRCNIDINLDIPDAEIDKTRCKVCDIEKSCWTSDMTDQEKMKAFSEYVAHHFKYSEVNCKNGAQYTAYAARDLGLKSMILFPGGEGNQPCKRHIITYNIYHGVGVPGGHTACLVEYPDGSTLRYDVQGGVCWIRKYENKL